MKSKSKKAAARQLIVGLSLGSIGLLSILVIFYNQKGVSLLPTTDSQTVIFKTIEAIPDCKEEISSDEGIEWKQYVDKYNKFQIEIPSSYKLFKGEAQRVSDEEIQKASSLSMNEIKRFQFYRSDSSGIFLDFNPECRDISVCLSKFNDKTKNLKGNSILCKRVVSDNIYLKSQYKDSITGPSNDTTYWTTYVNSLTGVVEVSFGERGPDLYPYKEWYTKAVDSLTFLK